MTKVYVAAGHGKSITGTYDPGAVSRGNVEEKLNEAVCVAAAKALIRCGFKVRYDATAEQRSYIEAVRFANTWGADYAMEIHHNMGDGGSLALVGHPVGDATKAKARRIVDRLCEALGTANDGVISRDREYFNRRTSMPSCIVEVSCLNADDAIIEALGDKYAKLAGEAIAKAMCVSYSRDWVPPQALTFTQWVRFVLGKRL